MLILLACGHSEPFPPLDNSTTDPFQPGPPDRLTANTGDDGEISFTPDGKELVYVVSRRCIGFLPAHQGRAREWRCAPPEEGIADRYRFPVVSPTGRLAWELSRQREFESGPFYQAVVVAPLGDLSDSAEVTPVPFRSVVDDSLHREISQLVWVRGDSLVIVTDSILYLTDPANRSQPRAYERLVLPGRAFSVQSGRGGRVLYLRVRGESRVIEFDLASRSVTTLHDFGTPALGAAAVSRDHLVGAVPGALLKINLTTGRTDTLPTFTLEFNELAITPDGSDIIGSGLDGGMFPLPFSTDLYRIRR
jgi:hypothetical protein